MIAKDPRESENKALVKRRRKSDREPENPSLSAAGVGGSAEETDFRPGEIAPADAMNVSAAPVPPADAGQDLSPAPGAAKTPKRVVRFSQGGDPAPAAKKSGEASKDKDAPGKKKRGKYQHKPSTKPPKRVRKILSRTNPEVLKKLGEILELEKTRDPEAARLREEKEARRLEFAEKRGEKKDTSHRRLNKKTMRFLKKYGIPPSSAEDNRTTKKALSYRLLFSHRPLGEMDDGEALSNIRLLFLAHADHNVPKTMDKFLTYMKNNMCRGISDAELDRVMRLLIDNDYLVVRNNKLSVNVG
ncbi:MAG: hypothetical protein LBF41_10030 [Deltaproteobacteria bacterium]|nr:hypothetical protein [Deltaproteobacteria bacterium]